MGQTHKHMGQTDRQTDTHMGQTHTHMKNTLHAKKIFVCGRITSQMVLKHPPWSGDSKNVLRFEIGWWEGSYFWRQTNKRTRCFII